MTMISRVMGQGLGVGLVQAREQLKSIAEGSLSYSLACT